MAAYYIYIIALFDILFFREFNCVKIPQGEGNKSANSWGNLRAKGGGVILSPLVYIRPYGYIELYTVLYVEGPESVVCDYPVHGEELPGSEMLTVHADL